MFGTRHCNIGNNSSLRQWVHIFWEFSMRMRKRGAERRKKMTKRKEKGQGTEFYKCGHFS
eukprot:4195001-Ditylum_brightwellii.AAC.1